MKSSLPLVLLVLTACDGGPTAPLRTTPASTVPIAPVATPVPASPSPSALPEPPAAPRLRQPAEDATIVQARPFPGCPMNDARPWGFRIRFEWDSPVGEAPSYDLVVRHASAENALLNTTTNATGYTLSSCGSYVADHNLEGWEWRVRARDAHGQYGPWSRGRFRFEPCRVGGRVCLATG